MNTSLIDVICKLSPYIPKNRISKWRAHLNQEDLDYLIDLMVIEDKAVTLPRFSTRLYGELLRIRILPLVQMKIESKDEDHEKGQIQVRRAYEGTYIDIGDKVNGKRAFIQVSGRGGIKDLQQKIIYSGNDNKWRIYVVSDSNKGHYMLHSNETTDTHIDQATWFYHDSNKCVPIELKIRTWNV